MRTFNVLVRDLSLFKGQPDPLHEGAEPPCV